MSNLDDKISLMIPSYLNGTLSDAETQEVDNYAAQNPDVAADIEFQRKLKEAVKPADTDFVPGELGWAKLSKAMQEAETLAANDNPKRPKFWQVAAAILAVAVIGQAGMIGTMMSGEKSDAKYVTVSETPVLDDTIKLSFKSDITAKEMTDILTGIKGNIISGPSALGLYEVAFKSESECSDAVSALKAELDAIETISGCL